MSVAFDPSALDFEKGGGVVTVVAQDAITGTVLMVASADREAIERSIQTGEMHYRSRSRGLWHKGATSGNVQRIVSLNADCDGDSLLALVLPAGPACHSGSTSCFGDAASACDALGALDRVIAVRAAAPAGGDGSPAALSSYTQRLLADRNLRLKKIGEESAELVVALADADRDRAVEEASDVLYHTLVALRALGLGLDDIRRILFSRDRARQA
jgi:phosphoribosyl-ATP pyrophosphohydrolase/phosphoribosyl-AMP cyclohydrolase